MNYLDKLKDLGFDKRKIEFVEGTYREANLFFGFVGRFEALYNLHLGSLNKNTLIERVEGPITPVDARVGSLSLFYRTGKDCSTTYDYKGMCLAEGLNDTEIVERGEIIRLIEGIRGSFNDQFTKR